MQQFHLASANSAANELTPVALPPGRSRLATRPFHRVGGSHEDDRNCRGAAFAASPVGVPVRNESRSG